MQPRMTGRSREPHAHETARARLAGAALLGLLVLAWWALRAAGIS